MEKMERKAIYDIIGTYVDLDYKKEYNNVHGIKVEEYFDGMDYRMYYIPELLDIGFKCYGLYDPYYTELLNKDMLCCISYCERDLMVVWYKDEEEFLSENPNYKS